MLASFARPSLTLDPLIAEAKRRARKRRALVAIAVTLFASGSAGLTLVPPSRAARGDGTIVGGVVPAGTHSYAAANVTVRNSHRKAKLAVVPHLTFREKLVKVATTMARNLGDPSVNRAWLYGPASYQVAFKAFSGGATTPNQRKGRFCVIVLHGSFRCTTCNPGSHLGRFATAWRLWSPTGHGGGTGLRNKLPASMSELGRPKRVSLR